MVAYPLVVAGHTVIRTASLLPTERPHLFATMNALRSMTNATTLKPDVATDMDTLRACVALAAPLRVCEFFLLPGLLTLVLVAFVEGREQGTFRLRKRRPTTLSLILTCISVVAAIFGVVIATEASPVTLGDYLSSALMWEYLAYVIVIFAPALPICTATSLYFTIKNVVPLRRFWSRGFRLDLKVLFPVFCLLIFSLDLITFLVIIVLPGRTLLILSMVAPDVGVELAELDQAAAASVGLIALFVTAYEASKDMPKVARFMKASKIFLGLWEEEEEEGEHEEGEVPEEEEEGVPLSTYNSASGPTQTEQPSRV